MAPTDNKVNPEEAGLTRVSSFYAALYNCFILFI